MNKQKSKKEPELYTPDRPLPKWPIFFTILILLIVAIFLHKSTQRRRLDDKLQAYRDAGLPATAAELEKWIHHPPPEQNAAVKLLEAAALFTTWDDKPVPNDPNRFVKFPLLHPGIKQVDSPPADWDKKNANFLPWVGNALSPEIGQPLDEKTTQYIAEFLDDNAEAMQLLHEAVKLKQSRLPVDYSQDINFQLPDYRSIRRGAKRLHLETLLHLENRRPDLATRSVIASFQLARTLYQEPMILSYLVGKACSPIAVLNLKYTLNRCSLNHNQLNDIADAILEMKSAPGLSLALTGDRCLTSDALYHHKLDEIFILAAYHKYSIPVLNIFGLVDMNHIQYLNFMDQYIAASNLPLSDRLQAVEVIEDELSNTSRLHFLVRIIMPLTRTFEIDIRRHAQLNNARTALAVEHYRLDHPDQFPGTLSDLVPDYIETLPIDPYDGNSIKYKKTNSGYIVYSIGEDKTDNDGVETNAAGEMFAPGTDIIFCVKRKNDSNA